MFLPVDSDHSLEGDLMDELEQEYTEQLNDALEEEYHGTDSWLLLTGELMTWHWFIEEVYQLQFNLGVVERWWHSWRSYQNIWQTYIECFILTDLFEYIFNKINFMIIMHVNVVVLNILLRRWNSVVFVDLISGGGLSDMHYAPHGMAIDR